MSVFYRDIDVKISDYKSELSKPLIVYERDRGLEIYFNLIEYAYRFDKNPSNLLENLVGAYATVTLVNPSGDEIRVNEVEITEEAKVKFVITEDLTDELTEIGTYQLQIHVNNDVEGKDTSVFSVPPFNFEVRERLKGRKNELLDSEGNGLTDKEGYQLVSATSNRVINFSADEINKYLRSIPTIQGEIKDLNSQLDTKPNKNHIWNMANMGQDVKEAITGGSVAVVGKNSVLSENIVEKQVTIDKLEFSSYTGKTKNLFNKNNGEIKIGYGMYGSGDEYADDTKFISYYIPISKTMGTYVRCGAIVDPIVQYTMQFYDNNKSRIGNGYGNVLIPDNTAYMRFGGDLANIDKIIVNIDTLLTNYYDYSYINANNFYINNKKIVDIIKEYDSKIDGIASGDIYTKNINCYGDSLTYGEPISSVTSYPKKLTELLPDYTIKNYGVPSFTTEQIMGYIGCGNFIVKPFIMPTSPYSGGKVKIEIDDNIYPILQSATLWDLFNPVTIDGIEGKLTRTGNEIYFYFDGSSPNYNSQNLGHIVKYPTVLKSKISENENSINIVFMGQNDLNLTDDELISKYRNVARKIPSKYLFLGLTTSDLTTRKTLENKMKNEFGRKYINLRQYMCDYGLKDEGLTATTQDSEFIAQGKVPPQLLQSDLVHGQQSYYNIIANQVYLRGKELGYW